MEQKDDIWLKQWKESLDDFEEEIPVGGWEKLQAELQANDPLHKEEPVRSAKIIPFHRWQVAAAAAVVLLVAGAGIWFLTSDKVPQVPTVEAPIAQIVQADDIKDEPVKVVEEPAVEAETVAEEKAESKPRVAKPAAAKPAAKPVASQPAVEKTKPAPVQETAKPQETAVSETAAVVEPKQEERVGSPIQVRTLPREQAQRSTTPVAVAGRSDNDNVNTINKRTVKISDNPALQNVSLLRRGESAATRSASSEEITDMDRVFNSYYAHLDELYSQKEHLFDNGAGDYSTVDNALFLAALVKKMQGGRNNEDVKLYREMASRLVALQQSDGLWKESLLSSTSRNADIDSNSFICYALAWGLNNGILSKSQYLEPVRKAWRSIGNCNSEAFQLAEEEMNKL